MNVVFTMSRNNIDRCKILLNIGVLASVLSAHLLYQNCKCTVLLREEDEGEKDNGE